jgi:hypothetical protein
MKKILLTLLLPVSTLLFANEINENFDNSEIILSKTGKVLEVTFDNYGKSYNVELFKLDEKSNSILDFDVTEDALMVNFKDYKQGAYILTIDAEFKSEEVLIFVGDATVKIIDRRVIHKPVYQFKDKNFKVIVREDQAPIDVVFESLSGNILHKEKYTSQDLNNTVFRLNEAVVVCLNYNGKNYTETIDLVQ